MKELEVIVKQNVGDIQFNYDEIKAELQARMELYKDAYFTEESKTIAKKEVAALRKMKDAIDRKRKDVKNQCLEPYKEFEDKAKELMYLIDEPIALIDGQVKAFEEKRKVERRSKVREIYDSLIGELGEYIPFDKIYVAKWDNASTTLKVVREEMSSIINSAQIAVDTIMSMNSEKMEEALEYYKGSLDMAGAIQMINLYEKNKAEILKREQLRRAEEDEKKRRDEEMRIRQQERERIAEEERSRQEEKEKAAQSVRQACIPECEDDLPFEQPTTLTVFYKVVATPEELEEVEMAFNSIGIYFERRDA